MFALWTQHDTVLHNLALPGDTATGSEHVSGLITRPGSGTDALPRLTPEFIDPISSALICSGPLR